MLISDMFPDRAKCPPTKMKDYSPERLPSEGGRLNEDLLVGQWSRAADEKLRRLTRKPARRHDEKAGPRPRSGELGESLHPRAAAVAVSSTGSVRNDASHLIRSDEK